MLLYFQTFSRMASGANFSNLFDHLFEYLYVIDSQLRTFVDIPSVNYWIDANLFAPKVIAFFGKQEEMHNVCFWFYFISPLASVGLLLFFLIKYHPVRGLLLQILVWSFFTLSGSLLQLFILDCSECNQTVHIVLILVSVFTLVGLLLLYFPTLSTYPSFVCVSDINSVLFATFFIDFGD
jgi:hypothetical protein